MTRKIFPPIILMISSLVQLPCASKYSINIGYVDASLRSYNVLKYLYTYMSKSTENKGIHTRQYHRNQHQDRYFQYQRYFVCD
jgi:hypothetical protein